MLPDWPRTQAELQDLVTDRIRMRVHYGDPALAGIGRVMQHEGKLKVYHTVDGERREMEYKPTSAGFQFTQDELITFSLEQLLARVDEAADKMQSEIARTLFARIQEVTEETGNVVHGKPFDFDTFLAMLEKIEIDFDEETGEPNMPTMFVSPQAAEQIRQAIPQWGGIEEYSARHRALVERKRKEWHDREADRKLAD